MQNEIKEEKADQETVICIIRDLNSEVGVWRLHTTSSNYRLQNSLPYAKIRGETKMHFIFFFKFSVNFCLFMFKLIKIR